MTAKPRTDLKKLCAVFLFYVNELMPMHHELVSPLILASLHELNGNQCAVRHNSYRRQFTKAQLSIQAGRKVAFIHVFSVKDNTHYDILFL